MHTRYPPSLPPPPSHLAGRAAAGQGAATGMGVSALSCAAAWLEVSAGDGAGRCRASPTWNKDPLRMLCPACPQTVLDEHRRCVCLTEQLVQSPSRHQTGSGAESDAVAATIVVYFNAPASSNVLVI